MNHVSFTCLVCLISVKIQVLDIVKSDNKLIDLIIRKCKSSNIFVSFNICLITIFT